MKFESSKWNPNDKKKEKEQEQESNQPPLFRCTGPCSLQKQFSSRVEYELHMEYFHVKDNTSFGEL